MTARRLVAIGLALWAGAAGAYATVRLTFGPRPVYVNVRWADGEHREGTTWGYALTDRARGNIRALVEDPSAADTHQIHRTAFRVGYFAQRLPYRTARPWVPVTLEILGLLGLALGCLAAGLGALERFAPRLVRGPLAWLRDACLAPAAAASGLAAPLLRWIAARIPGASAEAVAGFRIVFGTAVLLYLLRHDVSTWNTAWVVVWGALFIAGAAARLSYVMFALGVFAWAVQYTVDISHHTVSALLVTLLCLLGSRWGDAWSVDAWRGRTAGGAAPQAYGFTVWVPSFVLGLAFAAAAFAKLFQGGAGWILNGTVKYHFLSDSREALVDWGLRAAQNESVAVLLSFAAVAIEAIVLAGVFARTYAPRLAAGVGALLLLSGFVLFQGVIWAGWWILLLSFLPWHRIGTIEPGAASPPARLAPAMVILVLTATQIVVSILRLEVSPVLSAYDMYSTTYASPADFESKASDAVWLVAIDEAGGRHQCRLSRAEADVLIAGGPGGALPAALRARCLAPSLRVKTVTVEADRVRVDWVRLRLEETGRVPLRSFDVRD